MSFSSRLAPYGGKRNNHPSAAKAKAEIRDLVLDELGAGAARVFDAYAGDGAMYRAVWHRAAMYVGCDLKWYRDERDAFVADNRRVMRCVDLGVFNVFDLDAWGSPWEQAMILSARYQLAPGERAGLVITDGSGLKLKFGSYPIALCLLAGVRATAAGGAQSQDELLSRALNRLASRMGADAITKRWQAEGKTGSNMKYVGVVLERKKKAPPARPATP